MDRLIAWVRRFVQELRKRRVIRVAVVYAGAAFVVLQLGEILYEPFGLPDWSMRLVTFLLILGAPLALALAWVYDLTEGGIEREEGSVGLEGLSPTRSQESPGPLLWIGAAVLAGALLGAFWLFPASPGGDEPSRVGAEAPEERSIAVLPFEALGQEEPGTFTEGIHDDLLTRLSNISDLKVISRTSVQQYRGTERSLPAIADSLGVRWVLEGGVQQAGGQIQVNAQLIDPRSDAHVWAEDYQRKLTAENLFAIQGEITREIAEALQAKLTAGEQSRVTGAPTENLDAYRLYVRGRSQLDTRSAEGLRRAVGYFREALQEDSTFALAWSGLADVQAVSYYASDSLGAPVPSQEEAARRALQLDPDLAEAHASMGQFYENQQNAPAALHHLRRAVELKPSYAQAHHWLGFLQLRMGRPEKALRHARRAAELSPQHVTASVVLAAAQLANEKPEEALREARRYERIAPKEVEGGGINHVALSLVYLGRPEEAQEVARDALAQADTSSGGFLRFHLAMAELAGGDESRARREIAKTNDHPPHSRALLHAALSELDAAFDTLVEANFEIPAVLVRIRYLYPDLLRDFREDPRYEELIRTINQAWGLNPDGTIPEDFEAPSTTDFEPDA